MPIILRTEHSDGQRTVLWSATEDEQTLLSIASLNKADFDTFSSIVNPGRRVEWLAVRALVKELLPFAPSIQYLGNGKPVLGNHTDNISISHSHGMVGITIHPKKNPGLDIEIIRARVIKITSRFIAEQEKTHLGLNPSAEQITLMWAAKEVMFKVYGQQGISFKNDFEIMPFQVSKEGKLEGHIHKGTDNLTIPMEYKRIGDFVLVQTNYCTG